MSEKPESGGLQNMVFSRAVLYNGIVKSLERCRRVPGIWGFYIPCTRKITRERSRMVREKAIKQKKTGRRMLSFFLAAVMALSVTALERAAQTENVAGAGGKAEAEVVLYSALAGGEVTSVANLSGGGTYNRDEQVTVIAEEVPGCTFEGWYQTKGVSEDGTSITYGGEAVSTDASYEFSAAKSTKLTAVYRATEQVTLKVNGSGLKVDGVLYSDQAIVPYEIGTKVTVEYTGKEADGAFYYWRNASNKVVSNKAVYTFTIVTDTELTAVTGESGETRTGYVEFLSAYNQVMQADTWAATDSGRELPTGPARLGYQFTGWSLDDKTTVTAQDILTKIGSGERYISVRALYEKLEDAYTVTVKYPDGIHADDVYTGQEGEGLTVTAADVVGKTFSYWSDAIEGGRILGYDKEYFVYVSQNVTLYAIYDVQTEAKPVIELTNAYAWKNGQKDVVSFEATRSLAEGYTLMEHGMLLGRADTVEQNGLEQLRVNGASVNVKLVSTDTAKRGVYTAYVNVGSRALVLYARGYMIVKNPQGQVETLYTDIQSGSYETLSGQTGNVVMAANKAGAADIDKKNNAVVYDSSRRHGRDAGSVKVTAAGMDNAINLRAFDFTEYEYVEFYVYTEAAGVQAGVYWLGDTNLVCGQWTRVRIDLTHTNLVLVDNATNRELWPNRDHIKPEGRLVMRFMGSGCTAGTEFWISSVKAYASTQVNDVSAVTGTESYASNDVTRAEYVTDKVYDGHDVRVKDSDYGSLKVTVKSGEAAVGLWNSLVNDISTYDQVYFYVYTDASNTKSGGWWCGDTPLEPGKWTRVTLKDSDPSYGTPPWNWNGQPIFDANVGPRGFAYRFMGGTDGTVFYITSLYAERIPKVAVTTKSCTADKESYDYGDTVTLTADPAPEGMVFDYFAVNDLYIEGNTFTATERQYTVEAVYRKANVVLAANMAGASGIDTNGNQVTYDTMVKYGDESGSIKVTASGRDNTVFLNSFDFTNYDYVEFYVYTNIENTLAGTWWQNDTPLKPGAWIQVRLDLHNATITMKDEAGNEFWLNSLTEAPHIGRMALRLFSYGEGGCTEGTEFWVSSVKAYSTKRVNNVGNVRTSGCASSNATAKYVTDKRYDDERPFADTLVKNTEDGLLKVTVTGNEAAVGMWNALTNDISMADQVYFYVYTDAENTQSGGWWCGDTPLTAGQWNKVTLTKDMKPQNWNGKDIFNPQIGPRGFAYRFMGGGDGTVFYVTSLYADMPFAAEPVEITATNCKTEKESYTLGEMVSLTPDPAPEGMVFDYYTVNGVYAGRNGFVVMEKQCAVDVVYREDYVVEPANQAGAFGIDGNGSAISYDTDVAYEGEDGSIKVTAGTNDNGIYLDSFDFTGYNFVEFDVYTNTENTQAGTWWGNDTNLVPGQWTHVRLDLQHENMTLINDQGQEFCPNKWQKGYPFIGKLVLRFMGAGCAEGAEFWISSVKAYGSVRVNNVAKEMGTILYDKDAKYEYTTEKMYDGTDAMVKACDQGSLKVTVNGGESGICSWNYVTGDIGEADQAYFYVYTEASGAKAGGWWCSDTSLEPGKWTRVTLKNDGNPAQNLHGKSIFDSGVENGGPRGFVYRFMGKPGDVFYITSLYAGMPYDTGRIPDPNEGKEMWIGGWDVPRNTYEDYKLAKDMGLTHMFIDQFMAQKGTPAYYQQLIYCGQVGLKAIVGMDTNLDNPHNVQTDMFDYSIYPAVDMINLWDEVPIKQFPDVLERVRAMNELYKRKNMTLYVNLDPYNCTEQNAYGEGQHNTEYYMQTDKYLQPYCDTVLKEIQGRKILSTSIYPLRKDGVYNIWLDRLSWYAYYAKQENAEVHTFIQAFDSETERPITRKEELSYQIYTDMAFGIKGYSYFTYRKSLVDGIGGGCVDQNGNPTSMYYWAKEINEAVAKMDEVYLSYKWDGVLPLRGTVRSELEHCLNKVYNPLTSLACASGVTATGDTLVGQFVNDSGKTGLFVTNFTDPLDNFTDQVTFTFHGAGNAVVYRNGDATTQPVYNNQLTISLAPGEGVFVIPQ